MGLSELLLITYSKTCLKRSLIKKTKIDFQDRLSLNAGQKYYRMLQGEHSAILLTFLKLPFVNNTFVLSTFELPLKTGFTVCKKNQNNRISTLIWPLFCLENVVCFLHMLHTFVYSSARQTRFFYGINIHTD